MFLYDSIQDSAPTIQERVNPMPTHAGQTIPPIAIGIEATPKPTEPANCVKNSETVVF